MGLCLLKKNSECSDKNKVFRELTPHIFLFQFYKWCVLNAVVKVFISKLTKYDSANSLVCSRWSRKTKL